ncbi:oligopeptide transport system permease protein [Pseudooceanicola antarcticus]|uniref:Oligopeptide transport system permease protein OppC n=1 Tax=Pseudooceanicola antarcticus TaxID=1247613 RepID=A0A285J5F2_9RHOB|nr:ABC transporter permease subunit [Pseudooceanicola antarcticus]PJE26849.1 peptide ABC transporter permease [Pseudooceanicola antarcticus]SNY55504.1 oligopeptide transport system permease protein [Pseudooceanicola antarcticus]
MFGKSEKAAELAADITDFNAIRGRSLFRDAMDRFLRNKAAMASVVVLALIIAFVVFGPLFAQYSNEEIDWTRMGDIKGMGAPSLETGHYFGLDELGRDLFARTIQATQTSLLVGLIGAGMALIVGTAWGVIAGYYGGRLDSFMMRFVDIMLAIPLTLVLILILVIAGRSFVTLFVALGAVSWLTMSRIVRGQTLTLKTREFIEAARAGGVSETGIIFRHILPNLIGVVIVYASLLVPEMILAESFISFLGLGISEPMTSLGRLIAEGAGTMNYGTLWQLLFPLFFYVTIIITMFFIGDGLRDALDPKDR